MLAGLLFEVAGSAGFALLGEFLLALPQKKPKGLAPSSGPALRSGCLRSVIAPRGLGEGPSLAHRRLRRSLRLTPLRNDSTQPDERGAWALPDSACQTAQGLVFASETTSAPNAPCQKGEQKRCVEGQAAWMAA